MGKWTVGELEGPPQEAEHRAGMNGDPSISKVPTWLFFSVTLCVSLLGATGPASHIPVPVALSWCTNLPPYCLEHGNDQSLWSQ